MGKHKKLLVGVVIGAVGWAVLGTTIRAKIGK